MSTFQLYRGSDSCPICESHDGRCKSTNDLILCMTLTDAFRIPGYRHIGTSKDQTWGLWVPSDSATGDFNWRQALEERHRKNERKRLAQLDRAMPVEERDRHYRAILDSLTLHPEDRADLLRRGLTEEQIENAGFKSVVPWQPLQTSYPRNLPGIARDGRFSRGEAASTLIVAEAGYLCPVKDAQGRIQALQLRVRNAKSNKYRWVSSNSSQRLPSDEVPLAHYPGEGGHPWQLFTEGTGAKPLIASILLGCPTIGAAGGNFGAGKAQIEACLNDAVTSDAVTRVLAPDGGAIANRSVMGHYQRLADIVGDLKVLWWGQVTKADGDIDEVDPIRLANAQLLDWDDFLALVPRRMPTLADILKRFYRKSEPARQRKPTSHKPHPVDREYEKGDRLQTWKQGIEQGYKYILDLSPTGTGKSFDTGNINLDDLGIRQAIYLSTGHRNPTTETLSKENGWIDLEARHHGLVRDDKGKLRRAADKDTPAVRSNCNRTQLANVLRDKNIPGSDTAARLCGGCHLKEACQHTEGYGFGFLSQRRDALSSQKLRAHPDSTPSPEDYDYANTLLIWDEAGEEFKTAKNVHVFQRDIEATLARIVQKAPADFEAVRTPLEWLLNVFSGDIPIGRYGLSLSAIQAAIGSEMPDDLALARVTAALHPDKDINHLLNPTAQYGEDLATLPKSVRQRFTPKDAEAAQVADEKILKQWLADFFHLLRGGNGYLHIHRRSLTITLPDNRHRAIAQAAKASVLLDATFTREQMALKLGCSPDEILVVRQRIPETKNLTITQVTDMGRLSMSRGADQMRRVKAVTDHYKAQPEKTAVIDFNKFDADGAWWRDSRGGNDFANNSRLMLVGTPCQNVTALEAKYRILTGRSPHSTDGTPTEAFSQFVDDIIRADMMQGIGRIRAHHRPNERLEVVIVSDFDLGIPTNRVKACEITPEAATKTERLKIQIFEAVKQLKQDGKRITQGAIAKLVGKTRGHISRFSDVIILLINTPISKMISPLDILEPLANAASEAVERCETLDDVTHVVDEVFFEWIEPTRWQDMWELLRPRSRMRVLEALVLELEEEDLRAIVT